MKTGGIVLHLLGTIPPFVMGQLNLFITYLGGRGLGTSKYLEYFLNIGFKGVGLLKANSPKILALTLRPQID